MGNIYSIKCALGKVGFTPLVWAPKRRLGEAEVVVLPGVGDFSTASRNLAPIRMTLVELVEGGVLLVGICLGMQLLFQSSEEGEGEGLALLGGENIRLPNSVKVPHMGWNTIRIVRSIPLFEDIDSESYFYFAHSYYPVPAEEGLICAETVYGVAFPSVVAKWNIYGTQFHPEKSGRQGMRFLENLYRFVKR